MAVGLSITSNGLVMTLQITPGNQQQRLKNALAYLQPIETVLVVGCRRKMMTGGGGRGWEGRREGGRKEGREPGSCKGGRERKREGTEEGRKKGRKRGREGREKGTNERRKDGRKRDKTR